ncbi:MAG: complex I NDUFA9 subunit family protein [Litorimonas sp.]
MQNKLVTVFGGSGFLGRYVVRALVADGWRVRVALRRPHTSQDLKVIGGVGQVQLMQANLRYENSIEAAMQGADAVVNLVALLYETGEQTFEALHVEGADKLAKIAAAKGITNFAHVSSIGANPESDSEYSRTKGLGEARIRDAIPNASIFRPSVIFGQEDAFFNRFAAMSSFAPALPLFGGGETKFQPVYVADVAQAIAKTVSNGTDGKTYELGGPREYSFKELMQLMLGVIDKKRLLLPVPWFAANLMGIAGDMSGKLPFVAPFLTRDQVKNLKVDNVVAQDALTFTDIGITPETLEAVLPRYLAKYRKYGQFHEKRV